MEDEQPFFESRHNFLFGLRSELQLSRCTVFTMLYLTNKDSKIDNQRPKPSTDLKYIIHIAQLILSIHMKNWCKTCFYVFLVIRCEPFWCSETPLDCHLLKHWFTNKPIEFYHWQWMEILVLCPFNDMFWWKFLFFSCFLCFF